jgi:conjugative relaxase-like TrwC/TraI family protein
MMSLHKLTAGDGYRYLTRQVAAHDGTDRGYDTLGDYYAQKGESPGLWMGRGLVGLTVDPLFPANISLSGTCGGPVAGEVVTEVQMVALFGKGRHPDSEAIEARMVAAGYGPDEIQAVTRLGRPYPVHEGATQFRRRVATELEAYNEAVGRARGSPVPMEERARARTAVAVAMFGEEYGRAPLDDRERAGFLARVSRQATTAVAGYDLTFSPVKSVSALWAIAPVEVSRVIEDAHRAAVADTLTWLEDTAVYTRRGRAGVRQVDVTGLIAAAFEHRDSRAGDPDLHTHVAISNKVQTLDGVWLALDGRPLHQMAVAASERYNTRLEAHLVDRLGVRFADRPGTQAGKRAVREIVGVPQPLLVAWSARRVAIEERRSALSVVFQAEHGRPPSVVEAIHLAEQANLQTRQAKHDLRSLGEQRNAWREQARQVLGGEEQLAAVLDDVVHRTVGPHRVRDVGRRFGRRPDSRRQEVRVPDEAWVQATAQQVVQTVQASRATWREAHVRAEAERQARACAVPLADVDRTVRDVVHLALSPERSIRLERPERLTAVPTHVTQPEPAGAQAVMAAGDGQTCRLEDVREPGVLRRRDGTSVYETAGTALHTSAQVLAAEQRLLATAGLRDAPALSGQQIDLALVESTANGLELNPGQAQLVRELAGSGARLQLALAPAGTGKTTAMRVLARAWTEAGGTVLGLAPSAVAASVLRDALPGAHTDTLAKLTHSLAHTGPLPSTDRAAHRRGRRARDRRRPAQDDAPARLPEWIQRIGHGTLVVIDEAGMAGTVELATAVEALTQAGAVVRLIGDDQQLAAIGAGGVLRDLAQEHGAATLTHVVRFTDLAEGAASLALRAGDVAAVGFYLDNARLHVGDAGTAADQAYAAWRQDVAAGRDAVLLAPTRELVAGLNARARADRLAVTQAVDGGGAAVVLGDGSSVSAGDLVVTRRNSRLLMITRSDWVKNGYRWQVEAVAPDGSLRVRHLSTDRRIDLPAEYVREHVDLGYAATIHGAQGLTAEVCHVVASAPDLTRQLLYVALTRGRAGNHLYLDVAGDGNEHTAITRDALLPPTAADELVRILERDGAQVSATSALRDHVDPVLRLQAAAARYQDAVMAGAETRLGLVELARIQAEADLVLPGLSSSPAWETLRAHLALMVLEGRDATAELYDAVQSRELASALDPAAVLDWRLDPTRQRAQRTGPLPWLPGIPDALTDDPEWGPYLQARDLLVRDLAAQVGEITAAWTSEEAPQWAVPVLVDRQLVEELAIWRAVQSLPDTELAPAGPRPLAAAERRHYEFLQQQVAGLLGEPTAVTGRWRNLLQVLAPRVLEDAFWPQLAARIDVAARAGTDVPALLRSVTDTGRPLPDEHPASALWWRMSRELPPEVLVAATHPPIEDVDQRWAPVGSPQLDDAASQSDVVTQDDIEPGIGRSAGRQRQEHSLGSATPTHQPADDARSLDDRNLGLRTRVQELRPDPDVALADLHDDHLLDPVAGVIRETPGPRLPAARRPSGPGRPVVDSNVSVQRIAELNTAALEYFTASYPTSWAPDYLNQRLHLQGWSLDRPAIAELERFRPGYAPAGWTTLVDHLRAAGARDDELLAAGLAIRASTGRLIDRFRDRLVFPIHDLPVADQDIEPGILARIVGFVGRRNPRHDPGGLGADSGQQAGSTEPGDRYGPKYLNTATTALFDKSRSLFGPPNAVPELRTGAAPVLVEGPLDAIAVTLAGGSRHVGIASLGTAITPAQVNLLLAQLRPRAPGETLEGNHRTLVATDADAAGNAAAERAYWLLAARGHADVGRVVLPAGQDPAQVLAGHGRQALRAALATATCLADCLIDDRINVFADCLDTVEGRVFALRSAAEVVASQPPAVWPLAIDDLTERLGLLRETVMREVLLAVGAWNDRFGPQPEPGAVSRLAAPPTETASDRAGDFVRRKPSRQQAQPEPCWSPDRLGPSNAAAGTVGDDVAEERQPLSDGSDPQAEERLREQGQGTLHRGTSIASPALSNRGPRDFSSITQPRPAAPRQVVAPSQRSTPR